MKTSTLTFTLAFLSAALAIPAQTRRMDIECTSHLLKPGDYCAGLADDNGITVADIEAFNAQTWGWNGCTYLVAGDIICLSEGEPPMPVQYDFYRCGPQVSGTQTPTNGTALADLNPCPNNLCCNHWGQCGDDAEDFCTKYPTSTGAPGSHPKGFNQCISQCRFEA